ncbi:sulfatase [Prevotella herbatica]|uniref:Sulfatase n=1 Tax=Prevotella herbatica TaxID=2801997 RepID=A0ABM7NVK4_9BACT|nr:sulfatase [Prevotella herbatica]BCS84546.1 sulfatase [Prevotella herbatica]
MQNKYKISIAISTLCLQGGVLHSQEHAQKNIKHPNIIWITCEDISPYMSIYGADIVKTPNIDQLAHEGMKFQSVYTTAGVSAPSRSCFITGMYPTSIGTQHMRTKVLNKAIAAKLDHPSYSAVIPSFVKCFTEYLRMNGYYTTNCMKEDYQFDAPVTAWDESSAAASYRNRPAGKPFFAVFNHFITHESQLFKKSYLFENHPELLINESQIKKLPSYYKNTKVARECMALMLSNVQMMDYQVGQLIKQLKADGVYDNSYVIFFSDHGGTMPWMKREILERGTHIPFIVKFPKGANAGKINNDLISSVDFAPTMLSLAGVKIPNYMQGQAFLGSQTSKVKRQYVFAGRDRMDECTDRVRSVRDHRYRYIYNFMPNQPKYQAISYRERLPMMKEILELHKAGELDQYQDDWFTPIKPQEELYDVEKDPDEIHNLATDLAYKDKLIELRKAFRSWLNKVGDLSYMPEKDMVANWWMGEDHEPRTAEPIIKKVSNGIKLYCSTQGASIGYKILRNGENDEPIVRKSCDHDMLQIIKQKQNGTEVKVSSPWNVYQSGQIIHIKKGYHLLVNATRIGYTPAIKDFHL